MAETAPLDRVVDATEIVSRITSDIGDPLWRLELAAHAAMAFAPERAPAGALRSTVLQTAASLLAMATLLWLALRHGGTSPAEARGALADAGTVFALHGEDSTRTRHLREAMLRGSPEAPTVLLLGRPNGRVDAASGKLDPDRRLAGALYLRPVTFTIACGAVPRAVARLVQGARETARYRAALPFRDRVAIAFRIALGAAQARWWREAAAGLPIRHALFAHTGTADTSQLEQAMQAQGTRTVHVVHGTNIGWAFAGLSDVALFPSGADARLGASLPAYGRCLHLPLERPPVSAGNGDWALLTSYTHLQHPSFAQNGSRPDGELVGWMRDVAAAAGHDPARVFWRPHPQIELVGQAERERLEAAVADAGFTRWPDDMAYDALRRFSVVVTTPSTVLTDALRLGQPAIVASLTPLQRDLLYARYPLLVESAAALRRAVAQLGDPDMRNRVFTDAWEAVEPGARLEIARLLAEFYGTSEGSRVRRCDPS